VNDWVLEQVRSRIFSERERFWRALEDRLPKTPTGERVAWPNGLLYLTDLDWEEALRTADEASDAP
jgi:hypothetical protein